MRINDTHAHVMIILYMTHILTMFAYMMVVKLILRTVIRCMRCGHVQFPLAWHVWLPLVSMSTQWLPQWSILVKGSCGTRMANWRPVWLQCGLSHCPMIRLGVDFFVVQSGTDHR